jgi:regulator of sigma E protease
MTIIATIVLLSVLVIAHEFGHYLAARRVGVRVDRFSVGLGPKLLSRKFGETEYCLSLIPVGGYVKLAGSEPDEVSGAPDEFLSKPLPHRWLIISMGPVANLILAFLVLVAALTVGGGPITGTSDVQLVVGNSAADSAGIYEGDRILSIDGVRVSSWDDVEEQLAERPGREVVVLLKRGDEQVPVTLAIPSSDKLLDWHLGIQPVIVPEVGSVQRGSPAQQAGIQPGDVIVALDGEPVGSWNDLVEKVSTSPEVPLQFRWKRGGEEMEATVTPERVTAVRDGVEKEIGVVGIVVGKAMTPWTAISQGAREAWRIVRQIFIAISLLVRGQLSPRTLGGPILIVQMTAFSARLGLVSLLRMMAIISMNLGIFNLLPFPPLDGGHLLLFSIEGISRRPLSRRTLVWVQQIGFGLIMLLFLYVIMNDVRRMDLSGRVADWMGLESKSRNAEEP